MSVAEIRRIAIETDDQGFMLNKDEWTREIAAQIAIEEGIADLTERHWEVIEFMRKEYDENGTAPSIRRLKKTGGVPVEEQLYELFPGGPAKKASKIAGLPKPKGCV